jgi:hypothetical protein
MDDEQVDLNAKAPTCGVLQSPLMDSNRRPLLTISPGAFAPHRRLLRSLHKCSMLDPGSPVNQGISTTRLPVVEG